MYGATEGNDFDQYDSEHQKPYESYPYEHTELQNGKSRFLEYLQARFVLMRDRIFDVLMPWAMFALCIFTFGMQGAALYRLSLLLCGAVCIGCVLLASSRSWRALTCFCIGGALVGSHLGFSYMRPFIMEYRTFANSRWYSNVLASENPVATKDASKIVFTEDVSVDYPHSVGYLAGDGKRYCAAPILRTAGQNHVGFWAVGTNCCGLRSGFACGEVGEDSETRGGIVVLRSSVSQGAALEHYQYAARMACEAYGLSMPTDPTFLLWTSDVSGWMSGLWESAYAFAFVVSGYALLLTLLAAAAYFALFYDGLTFPLPFVAAQMWYGFDCSCLGRPAPCSSELRLDLLRGRVYWSGEVFHDYGFHVCNTSIFLSPFACHPAHPFGKLMRAVVLVCVVPLVLLPVAYMSLSSPEGGLGKVLWIVLCVSILPTVIRKALMQIADERLNGGGHMTKALEFWALILAICIIMAITLPIFALVGIHKAGASTLYTLWQSCDGLCYAFVVDLLLDLIRPRAAEGLYGRFWLIGFFGRWMGEAADYSAGVTKMFALN